MKQYFIDFVTPADNGITTILLRNGKRAMWDDIAGTLAYRVRNRVFEFTPLKEIIVLLFLVRDAESYAVFKINKDSVEAYTFDLRSVYQMFAPDTYNFGNTAQSNSSHDLHAICVSNIYIFPTYTQWSCYGASRAIDFDNLAYVDPITGNYTLGLRNSFEPANWNGSAGTVFNEDTGYIGHNPDTYVCSARKNWMVYEGRLIKNLEVWCDTGTLVHRIEYDDSQGHYTFEKPEWPLVSYQDYYFHITRANSIEAIISPTKYIGRGDYHENVTEYTVDDGTVGYTHWHNKQKCWDFIFGDVVLDIVGGSVSTEYWYSFAYWCQYLNDYGQWVNSYAILNGIYEYCTNSVPSHLDYDCSDNDDQTFIMCYMRRANMTRTEGLCYIISGVTPRWIDAILKRGYYYQWWLAYRCKGGELVKFQICRLIRQCDLCEYWELTTSGDPRLRPDPG